MGWRRAFLVVALLVAAVQSVHASFEEGKKAYDQGKYEVAYTNIRDTALYACPGMQASARSGKDVSIRECRCQQIRRHVPEAQLLLAVLYELGRGVARDHDQAVQWFFQAVNWGLTPAEIRTALGVPQHTDTEIGAAGTLDIWAYRFDKRVIYLNLRNGELSSVNFSR